MSESDQRLRFGLALQGGGSYGIYTKAVLERILPFILTKGDIVAVTGTSAGAMNGALLVRGLNDQGHEQSIRLMNEFWDGVRGMGVVSGHSKFANAMTTHPFLSPPQDRWPNISRLSMDWARVMRTEVASAYTRGMLRDMIDACVGDWRFVQRAQPTALYINAVRQGDLRGEFHHAVFEGHDIDADAVVASAALRLLGAHRKGNDKFFDGAYIANPHLDNVLEHDLTDLIIITLHDLPKEPNATNKTNPDKLYTDEIHYDILKLHMSEDKKFNLHVISMTPEAHWNETSRLNNDPLFLDLLEARGHRDGIKWLEQNLHRLGTRTSYNPPKELADKFWTPQARAA
jgi:NTE family protein